MLKVLILGVNGFIGHHLTRHIIENTDWEVHGMDMQSDRVAIELTRDIVSREKWPQTQLRDGDRLEIVHFVGGGSGSALL